MVRAPIDRPRCARVLGRANGRAQPPGCVLRCPGCAERELDPGARHVRLHRRLLRELGPWAAVMSEGVQGTGVSLNYRDRVSLHVAPNGAGPDDHGRRVGLLRDLEVVDIRRCPVHSPRVRAAIAVLSPVLPSGLPVRFWVQNGGQLTLVVKDRAEVWGYPNRSSTRRPRLPPWLNPDTSLRLAAAGIDGVWLHFNPCAGDNLFIKRGWHLSWGQAWSRDANGLLHGPSCFQQVNPALHRRILDAAEAFLAPGPGDQVFDLYCGYGGSLPRWTARRAHVVGVERSLEAVRWARINALHARVLAGPVAQRVPQLRAFAEAPAGQRLAFVNPPRTGLEPAVRAQLSTALRCARLAYLSCSPRTLARDLAELEAAGYRVTALCAYDLFPRTPHVETLALLRDCAC